MLKKTHSFLFQLTLQLEKSVESQKKYEEDLRQNAEKRDAMTQWEERIKEILQMYVNFFHHFSSAFLTP